MSDGRIEPEEDLEREETRRFKVFNSSTEDATRSKTDLDILATYEKGCAWKIIETSVLNREPL